MEQVELHVGPKGSVVLDAMIVSELRFLQDSLVEILSRIPAIRVCGQAGTMANALASAETMRPGIVLLDVAFPRGTEAAAGLCALLPEVNVIAFGVREIDENVLAWAEAGVVRYVPNTASVDDVVSLIEQISRGEQSCPSHIAGSLLRRIAGAGRAGLGTDAAKTKTSTSMPLTYREREIFRLLGAGLSNKEIARRLCISLGTTKSHVHNLFGKLSVKRRTDVITRAHGASP